MSSRTPGSQRARRLGWTAITGPKDTEVRARIEQNPDGRWTVTGVLVEGEAITSDTLRKISLGRLEALANTDLAALALSLEQQEQPEDDQLTLGELRALAAAPASSARTPLGRPDGSDAFYQEVARAYASAAAESSRPAVVLAQEAGVLVSAVHRWVREARRRGHLPPGKKGKAG
ncbi:hypothetical protein [Streptosporangium carneum]|uniref:Uncharacterized protein n=1 Tax=Streptosporangium carneum TaxID=47481 RepID=A0A9W6HWD2_9ACTN|nr:hypothetical protein [Streptosporangium carneum]GLK07252.1 hypothetical protein GCM10017600_06570 [Streptosporangium carneum]